MAFFHSENKPAITKHRIILLILAIFFVGLLSWAAVYQSDQEMQDDLLDIARLVANTLDTGNIRKLSGTAEDIATPEYMALKNQLIHAKTAHNNCRFIYLMGRKPDGRFFFFVDSEPIGSAEESPAGQIYNEMTALDIKAFETRSEIVTGIQSDSWGTWRTTFVPVFDEKNGEFLAMLGIDVDALEWHREVLANAIIPISILLVLLIVIVLLAITRRPEQKEKIKPLQRRLMIPLSVIQVMLICGFGYLLVSQQEDRLHATSVYTLNEVRNEMDLLLSKRSQIFAAIEHILMWDSVLKEAITQKNSQQLLTNYKAIFSQLQSKYGITQFSIHGPDRVNLARLHSPQKKGDLVNRFSLRQAQQTGQKYSGIELDPQGRFTLRVVQPIFEGAQIIGYLEMGSGIDELLWYLHSENEVELALMIDKEFLNRHQWEQGMQKLGREAKWERFPKKVLTYSTLSSFPVEVDKYIGESNHIHMVSSNDIEFAGRSWKFLTEQISEASGKVVGDLIVLRDITTMKSSYNKLVRIAVAGALVLLLALFGVLLTLVRNADKAIQKQQVELAESEERLDMALSVANDGVWDWHLEDDTVLFDDRYYAMAGYEPNEFASSFDEWEKRVHPDDILNAKSTLQNYLEGQSKEYLAEFRFRKKNGSYMWIRARGKIVATDLNGNPSRMVGTHSDITEQKSTENALKDSENKYRILYETSGDAVMLLNERHIIDCNDAALAIFGNTSKSKFCNMHPAEFSPPRQPDGSQSRIGFDRHIRQALKSGHCEFEWNHVRSNGEDFLAEVHLNAMKISENTVVQAIVRDITERKRAEEELRKAEERFRGIAESISDWIWEVDAEGRYTYCSGATEHLLGYTSEEIIGKTPFDLMLPKEAEKIGQIFGKIVESKSKIDRLENWNQTKSGELICLQTSGVPILDDAGNLIGYRGVDTDITEKKLAEQKLIQSKSALEEINQELERQTMLANDMAIAAELANAAKSEFLAKMSHEIRTPMNGVIGISGLLLDTELTTEQREFTETIQRSGNALLSIINDILDFSKIEAGKMGLEHIEFDLQIVLEEIGDLMALNAHEKGLVFAYYADADVPTKLIGDAGRIRQVLINLISNAIKFTQDGEVVVSVSLLATGEENVTLRFAVRDTGIGISDKQKKALFEPFIQADGSTTRKFGGTGLGLSISKQLAELMGGEIGLESFEVEGSEFWFTAVLEKQANQSEANLEISESLNGKRILIFDENKTNREVLSRMLLQSGSQIEEAENGDEALRIINLGDTPDIILLDIGMSSINLTTLGKSILENPRFKESSIVAMLRSASDRGDMSRFKNSGFSAYLTKPIKRSVLHDALMTIVNNEWGKKSILRRSVVSHVSIAEDSRQRIEILLVDDNVTNQLVASTALKKLGYHRVDTVANGIEAIEALKARRYDLVLMDCQMPEMDGYQATAAIRDTTSPVIWHDIPIIAMTANAMHGDREKCVAAGMNDYIAKPLNQQDLADTIDRVLLSDDSDYHAQPEKEVVEDNEDNNDYAIFDRQSLLDLLGDDEEMLVFVIHTFMTDVAKRIDALKMASETKNIETIQIKAHTIKGAAANIRAMKLQQAASLAERAAESGDSERALLCVSDVYTEFDRLISHLREKGYGQRS